MEQLEDPGTVALGSPALPPSETLPAQGARRPWRRRLTILFLILFSAYIGRSLLLRGLAKILIVAEGNSEPDAVLIFGAQGCFRQAAQFYHSHPGTKILVIQLTPRRLEALGIVPAFATLARQELARRGVPAGAMTVLRWEGRTDWDRSRCLADWVRQHASARVAVLCDRFRSRQIRTILDRVIGTLDAGRVEMHAIPHPWHDESNWWHSKDGVIDFFNSVIGLGYTTLCGEDEVEQQPWDPDIYEQNLVEQP